MVSSKFVMAQMPDSLVVKMGITPEINGTLQSGEWVDSDSVNFINGQRIIKVFFKQDANNLYFAAHIRDTSYYQGDDLVISLDTDYNGGSHPQPDDFWLYIMRDHYASYFQGSGTGRISTESDGITSRTHTLTETWQMECCISHSRMGTWTNHIIGVEFSSYDTDLEGRFNFPEEGDDTNPDTWIKMTLTDSISTAILRHSIPELQPVYPNPFSEPARIY